MKKIVTTVIILCCLGSLGWFIYQRLTESPPATNRRGGRAVPVETRPIVQRTMRNIAQFTGTLLPASRFVVAPKVSGRVEVLKVNIGDSVHNGELVAILDSAEYDQEVAQAIAELEVIQASLADSLSNRELTSKEYERIEKLRKEKVASEADLDQAKARHEAASARYKVVQAQIKQKEAALEAAKVRQAYTRIHAMWSEDPSDGQRRVVAERFVDAGTMLRANDPIVSIVQTDPVIGVIHVIERDFPGIHVGQEATIRSDAWPDKSFVGRVARKAPVLKEESRQARVEIKIPNPQSLLAPGMFVRVRIQLAQREHATAVPSAALCRRGGKTGVFVVDPSAKKAHFVPVVAGITEDEWIQVIEPVLTGQVVTLGQHLLEDGGRITIAQSSASQPDDSSIPSTRGQGS